MIGFWAAITGLLGWWGVPVLALYGVLFFITYRQINR